MQRDPQIGDVIRTAKPQRSGEYVHIKAVDERSLAECRVLVKSGRWVLVERQEKERGE